MAEKPIKTPLPADLPEDWSVGQIVAPDGPAVGLTEQHGYNYLMAAVNRAQQGVNEVNEAFETVSGKRTCRFVVGTSTAGWTAADCDFLCDGTDDQEEINQAIQSLPNEGGMVVLLDGSYHLTGALMLKAYTALQGTGTSTKLIRESVDGYGNNHFIIYALHGTAITNLVYDGNNMAESGAYEFYIQNCNLIENVIFQNLSQGGIYVEDNDPQDGDSTAPQIRNCSIRNIGGNFIYVERADIFVIENNYVFQQASKTFIKTAADGVGVLVIRGNGGLWSCGRILLDGIGHRGGSIVEGNFIEYLEIANTYSEVESGRNPDFRYGRSIIAGNSFYRYYATEFGPAIVLKENTRYNFVTGNLLVDYLTGDQRTIEDYGQDNYVRFNSDDPGGSTPATVQQATPVIAVSPDGRVVASATQTAGQVAAGTKSATVQLSATQDSDFIPENIKENVTIFGVTGTLQSGGEMGGVSSFNGRDGAVMPQNDDYTAAMVGAIPAGQVTAIQPLTQAEYDALTTKSATTLYLVKEEA